MIITYGGKYLVRYFFVLQPAITHQHGGCKAKKDKEGVEFVSHAAAFGWGEGNGAFYILVADQTKGSASKPIHFPISID